MMAGGLFTSLGMSDLMRKTMDAINGKKPSVGPTTENLPQQQSAAPQSNNDWYSQAQAIGGGGVPGAYAPQAQLPDPVQKAVDDTGKAIVDWSNEKVDKDNAITASTMAPVQYDENGTPQANPDATEKGQPKRTGTLLSGLFGEGTTGEFEKGRVARGDAQGVDPDFFMDESNEKYDTAGNPLDKVLTDVLAVNTWLGDLRSNSAEGAAKSGGYKYKFDGQEYTEDELLGNPKTIEMQDGDNPDDFDMAVASYTLPNGEVLRHDQLDGGTARSFRPLAEGEEAPEDQMVQDDDGTLYTYDEVVLPSGEVITRDDLNHVQKNLVPADQAPEGAERVKQMFELPNGQQVSEEDLRDVEAGGKVEAIQQDTGVLNALKKGPKAPWEDIGDIVPWLIDTTANSLPYFIPGYNAVSSAARFAAAQEGYDPDTFDPATYTYEDKDLNKGQWVGEMASPITDYAMEKAGGMLPGLKSNVAGKTFLGRVAKTAAQEGGEEIPSSFFEQLADQGLEGLGKNQKWNPETGEFENVDTAPEERGLNILKNAAEGFAAGALYGGGLGTINQTKDSIKRKFGKEKYEAPKKNEKFNDDELSEIDRLVMRSQDEEN